MNAYDIETRMADEGRVALASLVKVHEIAAARVVLEDENVRVTTALVDHPPVLSHLVPADDPLVTEQRWIDAARAHFGGTVIVGRDLMEL